MTDLPSEGAGLHLVLPNGAALIDVQHCTTSNLFSFILHHDAGRNVSPQRRHRLLVVQGQNGTVLSSIAAQQGRYPIFLCDNAGTRVFHE